MPPSVALVKGDCGDVDRGFTSACLAVGDLFACAPYTPRLWLSRWIWSAVQRSSLNIEIAQ